MTNYYTYNPSPHECVDPCNVNWNIVNPQNKWVFYISMLL